MKRPLITVLTGLLPLVAASHTGEPAHGHDFLSGFFHPEPGNGVGVCVLPVLIVGFQVLQTLINKRLHL